MIDLLALDMCWYFLDLVVFDLNTTSSDAVLMSTPDSVFELLRIA
jgi:hypothetical protein